MHEILVNLLIILESHLFHGYQIGVDLFRLAQFLNNFFFLFLDIADCSLQVAYNSMYHLNQSRLFL